MNERIKVYIFLAVGILLLIGARTIASLVTTNIGASVAYARISGDYSRLTEAERSTLADEAERQRRAHGKPPRRLLPEDSGSLPDSVSPAGPTDGSSSAE